ncbi:hypothetical protein Bhyg_06773 [Pseudolycoriella hygida]|uniref:Uncharacterized protein n=1 Tax=Pseudolycoriella hygida TaxID=35572 RepID=A0A9Q0N1F5_9DIPT|nr:hypothetical protein Bhyg_06773 [Pseudolycoriella hygida]
MHRVSTGPPQRTHHVDHYVDDSTPNAIRSVKPSHHRKRKGKHHRKDSK